MQIKIEVTPVMRGCAYAAELRGVSPAVEAAFGFAEMKVLSFADLYAGKIVAAFDRQHPRDLFDIRDLLANEGIDDRLRAAFIVYLLSHNRPMAEVLAVRPKDIAAEFVAGFQGMTAQPVTVEELIAARAALVDGIVRNMPQAHRRISRLVRVRCAGLDAARGAESRPAAGGQMAPAEPRQADAQQAHRPGGAARSRAAAARHAGTVHAVFGAWTRRRPSGRKR